MEDRPSSPKKQRAAPTADDAGVPLKIFSMGSGTFVVNVPTNANIADAKQIISQAKDRRGSSLELFAGGAEEPLRDTESVARAATAEGGLFLLVRPDGIDRQALEAIYLCMGGEQWTNARGWTVTDDLSKWHGVTLGADGTVVELDLGANNVTGALPAEVGCLSSLQRLYMERNKLSGSLPAELGQLSALQSLVLHTNQLERAIPKELGQCERLTVLQLQRNRLTGQVPEEVTSLKCLRQFSCAYNAGLSIAPEIITEIKRPPRFVDLFMMSGVGNLVGTEPPTDPCTFTATMGVGSCNM